MCGPAAAPEGHADANGGGQKEEGRPNWLPGRPLPSGAGGIRTRDLLNAIQTRSQLRYSPDRITLQYWPGPDLSTAARGAAWQSNKANIDR